MAANATARRCPGSRIGHDAAAALCAPGGAFGPCGNSVTKLLLAACDSYRVLSGLALMWEGAPASQPGAFGGRKEFLQRAYV